MTFNNVSLMKGESKYQGDNENKLIKFGRKRRGHTGLAALSLSFITKQRRDRHSGSQRQ